jgi:hypothetical protein
MARIRCLAQEDGDYEIKTWTFLIATPSKMNGSG